MICSQNILKYAYSINTISLKRLMNKWCYSFMLKSILKKKKFIYHSQTTFENSSPKKFILKKKNRSFWKKFWRQKFPFIMFSVDFYYFFLNRNSLKAFNHFILKILKKMIFLKKHAGFARTLKFFFDFNVAHLKMTYQFSGVTNTTYIVTSILELKRPSLTEAYITN